ncbi:hypothetical protein [Microcoleus vaginatus]|uniref:hypothetical protein n=1 Tax=Microcoleus vaginatus TaxID=119532 RepID=UPI0032A2881C
MSVRRSKPTSRPTILEMVRGLRRCDRKLSARSVLNWAIGRIGIIKGNISAFTGQTLLSIAAPMPRLPPVISAR